MKKYIGIIICTAVASGVLASPWTTYSLPDTTASFNTWGMGHTAAGKFIYGENGNFVSQNSFGAGAYTQYANSPGAGTDPSFIATGSGTSGVIGRGGFAASTLMTFDPSNTSSSFTDTSFSIQNYAGRMRDASSLYIVGGNGTAGSNSLSYVTLDGAVNKVIISDISQYSTGFAMDAAGNLYVGDNDDGKIYKFSDALLSGAIIGSALSIEDGVFITDFGTGGDMGSLAVDANGVLWGAGWAHNGIVSYDQDSDSFTSWTPEFDTSHYLVDTFSEGGTDYVAFASANGSGSRSNVVYGFADAAAVPEPGTLVLMLGSFGGMILFRRRLKR